MPQPWERLAAYLGGLGHRFEPDAVPPRQFAHGFGNLNYLIELDGRPAVLRRPPMGALPPGANDMAREYRVLRELWRAYPLAPRALVFADDPTILGAPFFIMEYRPGLIVGERLPAALEGREAALADMLAACLAELHAVDPRAVGLETLGRPEGFLARTIEGWSKRAALASDGAPPPVVKALGGWFGRRPAPQGEVTLLHNDFKLDNVVLDPERPTRALALLDWDMATRGDPLFDLAVLLSYWSEPGDPEALAALGQMPTGTGGFPSRRDMAERYARATGRDLAGFRFHRALASFRLGVVFLQLGAQWRRGTVTDARYARFERLALGLLEVAHEIAEGRLD